MSSKETEQFTAWPHKLFFALGIEQSSRKGYWILAKWAPSNFANKLWQTEKKLFVWSCSDVVQIDKMLV